MRALARRFQDPNNKSQINEEKWGIAGLLHDADYEVTKETAQTDHTKLVVQWLENLSAQAGLEADTDIKDAILAHGWGYVHGSPQPKTKMEWSLYSCDELTGLIVAVALVKPEKSLAAVTVESVMKKWKEKSFAAGVNREQIKECEARLDIPLPEFIEIALTSMQAIAKDLGL